MIINRQINIWITVTGFEGSDADPDNYNSPARLRDIISFCLLLLANCYFIAENRLEVLPSFAFDIWVEDKLNEGILLMDWLMLAIDTA